MHRSNERSAELSANLCTRQIWKSKDDGSNECSVFIRKLVNRLVKVHLSGFRIDMYVSDARGMQGLKARFSKELKNLEASSGTPGEIQCEGVLLIPCIPGGPWGIALLR